MPMGIMTPVVKLTTLSFLFFEIIISLITGSGEGKGSPNFKFSNPALDDIVEECQVTDLAAPTITDSNDQTITGTTTDPLTYTEQGTYQITWSFNDNNGNITTAVQNVIVKDTTPPIPPSIPDATGQCQILNIPAPTTTDNCAGTITGTTTDPLSYYEQGNYEITWTFDDGNGHTINAIQKVIVQDQTVPVEPTIADAVGECEVTNIPAPITTDNCAGTITGTTTDPLSYYEQGNYEITWTFDDGNGHTINAIQEVIVQDQTSPVEPTIADAVGECEVTNIPAPTTTDNCAGTITGTTTDPLSYFEQGKYEITWTFDDGNGHTINAIQEVIVQDQTLPVEPTIADAVGECEVTNIPAPTTTDNCAGTITGTTTDPLSYFEQGNYEITWTFDDGNGYSTTAVQKVIVQDKTAPVEPTMADVVGECEVTNIPAPTTTDTCEGTITGTTTDPLSYFAQGTYEITWTFDDGNGHSTTAVQKVIVQDKTAPVELTIANAVGECEVTNIPAPITTDNCAGTITGTTTDPLSYFEQGTYTINWTFDDGNGNSFNVPQTVIVQDNTPPIVPQLEPVVWSCKYDLPTPVATDNCSGEILGTASRSTIFESSGQITWSFDDGNGNVSTATQDVSIIPIIFENSATAVKPVSCFGASDGAIEIIASGGIGTLKYSLDGGSFSSTTTYSGLSAKTYTIAIRDSNGCIKTENITLEQPEELTIIIPATSSPVTCFGGNDGTINVGTYSGGTGQYTYSTDNTNFTPSPTISGLPAGVHTIFVKDENGCSLQEIITIESPEKITATVGKTDVLCHGGNSGEIHITNPQGGSGTFKFRVGGGIWQTSPTLTGLSANIPYTVEIMDEAGCIEILEEAFLLNEPLAPLVVTASSTRTTTYGTPTGSATANASGGTPGFIYEWTRDGDPDFNVQAKTIYNLSAGIYWVKATDKNGCSTEKKKVEVVEKVTAEINAPSRCEDSDGEGLRVSTFSVDYVSVLGGVGDPSLFKYSWTFGQEEDIESITLEGSSYKVKYRTGGDKIITLEIIDEAGVITLLTFHHYVGTCFEDCGASNDFLIDKQSFFIGDEAKNPITESNKDSTKYLYLDITKSSNVYTIDLILRYTVTDFDPITNEVIGTHQRIANHCFATSAGPSSNDKPNWEKIPVGLYPLFEVTDEAADNTKIQWEFGQGFTLEGMTLKFGTSYNKECGDSNKNECIGLEDNVEVSTPIVATAFPEAVKCKGENLGSIYVNARGGVRPYLYSLDGISYQESNLFSNLGEGDFKVWVKDNRGQIIQTEMVTVTEPEYSLNATIDLVENGQILCYGGTASAVVSPFGGTPPYQYLWSDADQSTSEIVSELPAGKYYVTVTDANGCTTSAEIEITQPDQLTVPDAGEDQILGCGFGTAALDANTPTSGVGRWVVVSPENSTVLPDQPDNPRSTFSAPEGTYRLQWIISHEDGSCEEFDEVDITFAGSCERLDFDGMDDYIIVGDHYDLSETFSLEAWIKPESDSGTRTILSKRNWRDSNQGGFELLINNGAPTFRWNGSSISTSHKIGIDRWYHVAVVFSKTNVTLYVDGIELSTGTPGTPPIDNSHPFLIGAVSDAQKPEHPTSFFQGWIEEVKIWNTALTIDQLRFMMNQRIEQNNSFVQGEILKENVPGDLLWSNLEGYYRLFAEENLIVDGTTEDLATNREDGYLKNITSWQVNSAPLPYVSEWDEGDWNNRKTWDLNYNEAANSKWWTHPNDKGINGKSIDWNIASVYHDIASGSRDITLLGLLQEAGTLDMEGTIQKFIAGDPPTSEPGTGNGLTVTHYLKIEGKIDLNGESQLIQPEGSILVGSGTLERDQQGTASSYNYNYWTSPVSNDTIPNSGYTIQEVMKDGTSTEKYEQIQFNYQYHFADGAKTQPIKISSYWLNKFFGEYGKYSQWRHVGQTGKLNAGEGFSMKGSSGYSKIQELQNYTFTGFPNNGTIKLNIGKDQSYLIGNPYPSALDADKFIRDNIKASGGNNSQNVFNGTLYFWDHFSGQTHYLQEYVGGYATYNLSGGVRAIANDNRINNETTNGNYQSGDKIPQQFIPVGQAFFVNSILDEAIKSSEIPVTVDGGDIIFRNSQRAFMKETAATSVFHSQEPSYKKEKEDTDKRKKIWLKFISPTGYHRQLLVTADATASNGYDLGFDAILIENNAEDMYWYFNEVEFVIQGVPHLDKDQVLPLGMKIKKKSEFTIRIDELKNIPSDMEIYLKDNELEVLHDLRRSDYKATAEAGTNNKRFELVFQDSNSEPDGPDNGGEDGEEEGEEAGGGDQGGNGGSEPPDPDEDGKVPPKGLEIFYVHENREIVIRNPHLIQLNNALLNNTLGQQLMEYNNIPEIEETRLLVQDFGVGVYVITISTEEGPVVRKIITE